MGLLKRKKKFSRLWINLVLLAMFIVAGYYVFNVGWVLCVPIVIAWAFSDYQISSDYYGLLDRLIALVMYPLSYGSSDGGRVRVELRKIIFAGDESE